MYVNNRTIDYEKDGRDAIREFLRQGIEIGLVDPTFDTKGMKFIGSPE